MRNFLVFLILLTSYTSCGSVPTSVKSSDESAVRQLVEQFGKTLQAVNLQSPTATQQIQTSYAPFVDAQLLQQWATNLQTAPGRTVSSPWSDRIVVTSITQNSLTEYFVAGKEIFVTSMEIGTDKAASQTFVTIVVKKQANGWKITNYEQSQANLLVRTLKPANRKELVSPICAEMNGLSALVIINIDTPMPRCMAVTPDQHLVVTNHLSDTISVQLAEFEQTIAPGDTASIDTPFGQYLAPGIHGLRISAYGGGEAVELWLAPRGQHILNK